LPRDNKTLGSNCHSNEANHINQGFTDARRARLRT
jgi:hypothetical protein